MVRHKAAVIGYPVVHSLSPKIHGYWLQSHQLEGEYGLLEVNPEGTQFEKTLQELRARGYCGVNVTVPFKERAYRAMDEVEDVAKAIGAVNTIIVKKDGTLWGTNTDAYGFIQNIRAHVPTIVFLDKKAMLLGAGGAARAIIYGLLKEGIKTIYLTNRTIARAQELKTQFGDRIHVISWEDKETILKEIDILINSTVLGMEKQAPLTIDITRLPAHALVTDIVYKPKETPLLIQAKSQGNKTVEGFGMLLYQAQRGFELFFGRKAEVTADLYALNAGSK